MACFAPSTMTSESNAPNAFDLLGVSVVAGNAPATATFANAARLLTLFDAPLPQSPSAMDSQAVHLFNGSEVPLLKEPRSDPAIHGADGLGGVTGLPNLDDERVLRRAWASYKDQPEHHKSSVDNATPSLPPPGPGALLLHWQALLEHRINAGMPKMTMIATGPLTNVALLVRAFPRLVELGVSEIVIMGGAPPGTRGNRGPLAGEHVAHNYEVTCMKLTLGDVCCLVMNTQNSTSSSTQKQRLLSSISMSPSSWPASM